MKEPTAEWLAERSDIGLKLWIACCVEELHRRDPRGARALAKQMILTTHKPMSSAEPFPHMETLSMVTT